MLHILFLVLKIIGLTILIALGIVIFVLCLVLFYPVKYQIEVKDLKIHLKAHWLLHLAAAYYKYENNSNDWQVRIFWKKLNVPTKKKKQKKKSREEVKEPDHDFEPTTTIDTTKQNWFEKLKCTIVNICVKIKEMWDAKNKIFDFLTGEHHIRAFKKVLAELILFLKKTHPKKMSGFIEFGFEDPYNTGQVLALVSMCYPLLEDHIDIIPNFENKIFKGEFHACGYAHMITVIVTLFRIFFDSDVKRTHKEIKKLRLK